MATEIVENDIASKFGNSPQKTGEPLDHAKLYSGKALEFDGIVDYLDTGVDLESWLEQDDKTMSVWVRNDGNTAEARVFNVGYSGSGSTGSTGFALGFDAGTDNKPFYFLRNESAGALKVEFGEVQPVGTWHYYVIVQDTSENEAYIYQNGELVSTVSSVGVVSQSTDLTAKIGKFWTLSELNYFKGALSNFQLWNKAWSTSDVQYAYTNPERLITDNASVTSGITTSDLELWYPMNDTGVRNPQTVIFDAAGTNNTTKNHATTTFLGDELNTNANATSPTNEANATTGWSSVNINVIQSQSSVYSVGSYALELNENAGPTNGARAYMDLEASPFSLVDGRTYTLSVLARHVGSGGQWTINAGSSTSNTSGGVIATITNSTTSFTEYTSTWVHDGDHRYINIQENSSDNDGGLYIDKLSIKEVGIASGWTDADQQQTIPQTALMNGSVMQVSATIDENTDYISGSMPTFTDADIHSIFIWWFPHDFPNGTSVSDSRYGLFRTATPAWSLKVQDNDIKFTKEGVADYSATDNNYTEQKWFLTGYTRNGTGSNTGKFYTNGTAGTTFTPAASGFDGSTTYKIGSSNVTSTQPPLFGEVMMFDVELTPSEVTELYNNGAPLNATKHSQVSNLVGYWRNNHLTSAGTWEDLSSNNNHGTLNGTHSTIFFQEGITAGKDSQGFNINIDHTGSKGAVYFDGVADYIELNSDNLPHNHYTIMAWFKVPNVAKSQGIVSWGDSANYERRAMIIYNGGSGDDWTLVASTYNENKQGGTTLSPNTWYHGAVTVNKSTKAYVIYLNGESDGSGTLTNSLVDFTGTTGYIGRTGVGEYLEGFVDEVFIYDKVLTAGEVLKNYKHGKSKHKN